jgi:glycerate 2-kinase
MNILVAPNAFKGSLTAREASQVIAELILKKYPRAKIVQFPVADGGDGTCELLVEALGLKKYFFWSLDPLGRPIVGNFGFDLPTKRAFLDVSTVSGIGLLKEVEKDPKIASTYGTGILIKKALELGAEEIILGLGGSATVDLGTGILAALGLSFLDKNGRDLPLFSPGFISKIRHVQLASDRPKVKFICLCDVRNPFSGPNGAITVFGSQKGLSSGDFPDFEKDCMRVIQIFEKKKKGRIEDEPGFGAAGGISLGLSSFFQTEIKFGAPYFFELLGIEKEIQRADWIITGEGKYDTQSEEGKACFELLQLSKKYGKKTVLLTSGNEAYQAGFDLVLELPGLNFNHPDFKEKARENFIGLIENLLIL